MSPELGFQRVPCRVWISWKGWGWGWGDAAVPAEGGRRLGPCSHLGPPRLLLFWIVDLGKRCYLRNSLINFLFESWNSAVLDDLSGGFQCSVCRICEIC